MSQDEFDYPDIEQTNATRGAQILQIDSSKHISAVALCAIVCGLCAAISWWAVYEQRDTARRYRDDSIDMQDKYDRERNHVIELEARLKIQGEEIQEMKHERR